WVRGCGAGRGVRARRGLGRRNGRGVRLRLRRVRPRGGSRRDGVRMRVGHDGGPPASRSTSALDYPPPTRRPPPQSPDRGTLGLPISPPAAVPPAAAAPAASPVPGLDSTGTRAPPSSTAGAMDAWASTITSAPVTPSAAAATRLRYPAESPASNRSQAPSTT